MSSPFKILVDYGGTIARDQWVFDKIALGSMRVDYSPVPFWGIDAWEDVKSLGHINFFSKVEDSFFKLCPYYPEALSTISSFLGKEGEDSKTQTFVVFDNNPKMSFSISKIEMLLATAFDGRGGKTNGFYVEPDKVRLCKKLGIDLIVDDDPRIALATSTIGIKTFLILRPWNRRYADKSLLANIQSGKKRESVLENLRIVEDWPDVAKNINTLLQEG